MNTWGKEKKKGGRGNTKLALQNLDIILMNRKSMKGFKQDIHIIWFMFKEITLDSF